ncbi:MAG: prephenate dehydratase [Bacteroidales bacterium]|nr:prephenate dehydratase [Bacteroidales bacterium]
MKKVAIQGFKGCFHEEAARRFYNEREGQYPQIVECATFGGLYEAMEKGEADAAVMAVENTSSGGLVQNLELLRKNGKKVKGEVFLHIHQNLMAMPGQKIEDIREVRTHFMAINQTRKFFETNAPWINLVESEDTAKSATDIASAGLMGVGAVASKLSAEQNGLEILAAEIETYNVNYTRFLIMDDSIEIDKEKVNKASLCFTLPHAPGALAHILTILSFYEMNLTRIQSLPIPGQQWQYFFYADIRFDDYERYQQALTAIKPLMKDLNILGEYVAAV